MSYELKKPLNKLILFMVRRPTEVPVLQAHYERNQPPTVRPRLHGQIYCSCNICIHHIPVVYVGGRAPTVGALGDAWSGCREPAEGPNQRLRNLT
jgi:hypothetical protein